MPSDTPRAEEVVQRQLDAYNARDLDAWLATYAEDARQYEFPATLLSDGVAAIRERAATRFQEPNLHARLRQRVVIGTLVIDHEDVCRTFPEGPGRMEMTAIYEVIDGRIRTASFIYGPRELTSPLDLPAE